MNILIAHDGFAASLPIVEDLARAGLPSVGNATVLCVAEMTSLDCTGLGLPGEVGGAALRGVQLETDVTNETVVAEEVKVEVAKALPGWRVRAEVARGQAARAIIRTARNMSADLIVVGSSAKH